MIENGIENPPFFKKKSMVLGFENLMVMINGLHLHSAFRPEEYIVLYTTFRNSSIHAHIHRLMKANYQIVATASLG